jgi:4-diphosphocytidyl-2-C-methyl-D-erythritol kinase
VRLLARAPGKVNLCLFVGPVRPDGRHELVTLFESVSLADSIEVTVAGEVRAGDRVAGGAVAAGDRVAGGAVAAGDRVAGGAVAAGDQVAGGAVAAGGQVAGSEAPADDEVVCAGIDQLNIVTQTLDGLRAGGWRGPPVRVVIDKRIPVAGGMGGGSADAAAILRLAPALAPVSEAAVRALAASLGSDVPSQLLPGVSIGTGAGEIVAPVEPLAPHAFVIVPQRFGLSTVDVYREADRLGIPRDAADLAVRAGELRDALRSEGGWPTERLLVNDLEPAALSLRPEIAGAIDAVRRAGAEHAMVSGSGPTVFGLFRGADAPARAHAAAASLRDRYPEAVSAAPVSEEFGAPRGS